MSYTQVTHPTDRTLHAYALGKLDDLTSESVHKHLEACGNCQRKAAELSSDSFLGRLRDVHAKPSSDAAIVSSLAGTSVTGNASRSTPLPAAHTLPRGLADHPDYQILRELGRGGMGVVYLAQNTLMGRPEVLKVVNSHLINRPGVLDRFLREIRAAAKLHPPTSSPRIRPSDLVRASFWQWSMSKASISPRWSRLRVRYRSLIPAILSIRLRGDCSTHTSTAWFTATSNPPI
jgi:serine/threonine protein kinase